MGARLDFLWFLVASLACIVIQGCNGRRQYVYGNTPDAMVNSIMILGALIAGFCLWRRRYWAEELLSDRVFEWKAKWKGNVKVLYHVTNAESARKIVQSGFM